MDDPCFWPEFLIFSIFAFPISGIDICSRRIPDMLSLPCFLLIFFVRILFAPESLLMFLGAALFGGALFFCIRLGTGGLGLGDVKFAAVIGLTCGFPLVLAAFFIASVLGFAAAVILRISGIRIKFLPFGPFLCAGTVTSLLLAHFLQIFKYFFVY
ncbi:MAG: A24 family peptidase [Treponema sp.]|nr:A24 family peptidase [Treponema sp.]